MASPNRCALADVEVTNVNKDASVTSGPAYQVGVIVDLDAQFRKAKVVYRDCPKRVVHTVDSLDSLRAVPEVLLAPSFFSLQSLDQLAVFLFFLQTKLHPHATEGVDRLLRSWDAIYTQMKSCRSVLALASLLTDQSSRLSLCRQG